MGRWATLGTCKERRKTVMGWGAGWGEQEEKRKRKGDKTMDKKVSRLVEAVKHLLKNLEDADEHTDEHGVEHYDIAELREAVAAVEVERDEKNKSFTILWPVEWGENERKVTAATIKGWYRDAVSNGDITEGEEKPGSYDMAIALHEAGLITLKKEGN